MSAHWNIAKTFTIEQDHTITNVGSTIAINHSFDLIIPIDTNPAARQWQTK